MKRRTVKRSATLDAEPVPEAVPIHPDSLKTTITIDGGVWIGTDPPTPAPLLLTDGEAIVLLRLDKTRPAAMLATCRTRHKLAFVMVGGRRLYRRADLLAMLDRLAARGRVSRVGLPTR